MCTGADDGMSWGEPESKVGWTVDEIGDSMAFRQMAIDCCYWTCPVCGAINGPELLWCEDCGIGRDF